MLVLFPLGFCIAPSLSIYVWQWIYFREESIISVFILGIKQKSAKVSSGAFERWWRTKICLAKNVAIIVAVNAGVLMWRSNQFWEVLKSMHAICFKSCLKTSKYNLNQSFDQVAQIYSETTCKNRKVWFPLSSLSIFVDQLSLVLDYQKSSQMIAFLFVGST